MFKEPFFAKIKMQEMVAKTKFILNVIFTVDLSVQNLCLNFSLILTLLSIQLDSGERLSLSGRDDYTTYRRYDEL